MAGWFLVLLSAVAVVVVCVVLLLVLAVVGARLRLSSGPVVVAAHTVAVLMLLGVLVTLGAALWGSVSGMLATFAWRV